MILDHKHLIIRGELISPPRDTEYLKEWLRATVKAIRMNLVKDIPENPIAFYCDTVGNRGLTALAIIETSHLAVHVWDEDYPGIIQMDVYSCADFTPHAVIARLEEFEPLKVEYKFIDRNRGLTEINLDN